MSEQRTHAVHVHEGCDVYVGRAIFAWKKAGPLNPVPGRFGNPFKPGGVKPASQKTMLRTYFEPWLGSLPEAEAGRIRDEAQRRMGPEPDPIASFRWYLDLRTRHDPDWREAVLGLRGQRLGCWCKPGPCHGDVLSEWVEAQPRKKAKR